MFYLMKRQWLWTQNTIVDGKRCSNSKKCIQTQRNVFKLKEMYSNIKNFHQTFIFKRKFFISFSKRVFSQNLFPVKKVRSEIFVENQIFQSEILHKSTWNSFEENISVVFKRLNIKSKSIRLLFIFFITTWNSIKETYLINKKWKQWHSFIHKCKSRMTAVQWDFRFHWEYRAMCTHYAIIAIHVKHKR